MISEDTKYGVMAVAFIVSMMVVNVLVFAGSIWLVIYVLRCAGVDI